MLQPIKIRKTFGRISAGGARVTCKNCFTSDKTEKRSPATNCSRVKKIALSACLIVERADPSDNSKLMSSRTQQKDLSSSMEIET